VLGSVGEESSQSNKKVLDGWVGLQQTEGSLVIEHLFSNFQTLKCFPGKKPSIFFEILKKKSNIKHRV
jgi:hypothetical protein